jgi:hypothetical protein
LVSIVLWLFLSIAIPMMGVSIVAPVFSQMEYEEHISASSCWLVYWAAWVPLHVIAWFAMLPGRSLREGVFKDKLGGRPTKMAGLLLVAAYWIVTIAAWRWLVLHA